MSDDLVKRVDSLMALLNMERKKSLSLGKRIEKLEAALRSIAANACCDSCREAALVARKALGGKDGN
jgi:BMFP domain-containing protein YqiC